MRYLTPDSGRCRQGVEELRQGMEGAVTRCAGLVCQLLDRLETGAPLTFAHSGLQRPGNPWLGPGVKSILTGIFASVQGF